MKKPDAKNADKKTVTKSQPLKNAKTASIAKGSKAKDNADSERAKIESRMLQESINKYGKVMTSPEQKRFFKNITGNSYT